jgi:hypothetical protein
MQMKISKEHFSQWKQDPVTIELFSFLEKYKVNLEEEMLNDEIILSRDSKTHLARLVGQRAMLNDILKISFEEVDYNQEEEHSDA